MPTGGPPPLPPPLPPPSFARARGSKRQDVRPPVLASAPQPPARNEQWVLHANGTLRNAQFGCIEVSANSGPPSTIWAKPLHDGAVALLAINGADMQQTFDLDLGELLAGQAGGQQKQWRARDVWAADDLGTIGSLTRSVPPHDCILLLLSPI